MRIFWLVWACFAPVLLVAQTVITGKVSDGRGLPLEGVNIVVQDSDIGTVSDASGSFFLKHRLPVR